MSNFYPQKTCVWFKHPADLREPNNHVFWLGLENNNGKYSIPHMVLKFKPNSIVLTWTKLHKNIIYFPSTLIRAVCKRCNWHKSSMTIIQWLCLFICILLIIAIRFFGVCLFFDLLEHHGTIFKGIKQLKLSWNIVKRFGTKPSKP